MTAIGEATRRHVLVTGGSRGIGRAIVTSLAGRGVDVSFTYRSRTDASQRVLEECADLPGGVRAFRHDQDRDDPTAVVEACTRDRQTLDAMILNAGVWRGGVLDAMHEGDWWQLVETNLRGTVRMARAGLKQVTSSPAGSITLVSSAVALVGFPGDTAYASSKAALTGFARSLSKEVGRYGTRVNVLAPGFVETDMTAATPAESQARILRRTALGRFAAAEEIAQAAVFLSEDATYATGVVLPIDGGWTL